MLNLALYMVGAGVLLAAYLPFSPATRDLVAFLSRDAEITLFRYRRTLWGVGIICLLVLTVRTFTETAGFSWLVLTLITAAVLGVLYWASYVPVVMAPPEQQRLVEQDAADELLGPDDTVLGLVYGNETRAYPRNLIARPHWFNDTIEGQSLMISYCILCNSAQAFVPEIDGRRLNLRNMTAYNNNTIYHDSVTGNYIQQLEGRVIAGPDGGRMLKSYPLVITSWKQWKDVYPYTKVLYAPPLTIRDRVVQKMLDTMIPISRLAARSRPWHVVKGGFDRRLPAMSFVFGVEIDNDYCAYPLAKAQEELVINDVLGSTPIVLIYSRQTDIGQAFSRRIDGRTLTFSTAEETEPGIAACDKETGTLWDVSGRGRRGELIEQQLELITQYNKLFWFSWAAFKPGTRIYKDAVSPRFRDR